MKKPGSFDFSTSQVIKFLREQKGFKQEVAASALRMDRSNYSRIENCKTGITMCQLRDLSKVFDTDLHYILLLIEMNLSGKSVLTTEFYIRMTNCKWDASASMVLFALAAKPL